jgi:hypothetical protein
MIAIIQQYIDSEWVELTRMPFDDHVKKVKIRLKKEVVIFNRLDGPIKIIVEEFEEFDYSKTEE